MNQRLLPFAAVVVLLLASVPILRTQPRASTTEPRLPPPRADFEKRVPAVGLVEPASENVAIASHLPGVVTEVLVKFGQEVRAGDPLVRLDTRALKAATAERRNEVAPREALVDAATARAGLADVKRN